MLFNVASCSLLALTAFLSVATADITFHTDNACSSGGNTLPSVSGECIAAPAGATYISAQGCSSDHYLRIHETADCSDNQDLDGGQEAFGVCTTTYNNNIILSAKCVASIL